MTKDYARKRQAPPAQSGSASNLSWFAIGFVSGIFCAFLAYLWYEIPADTAAKIDTPTADIIEDQKVQDIEWTFFEMFPKTEVPIVEEFNSDGEKVKAPEHYKYMLQIGSFRNPNDADSLRAEAIMLGFEPFIKEIEHEGQTWHRVMVGPIDTELEMNRARRKLAEADIASMQLRISQ